jgi:hypothetical protein
LAGSYFIRSPRYFAEVLRASDVADLGQALPDLARPVHARLLRLHPLDEVVRAARVRELGEHLEDLVRLEPHHVLGLGLHAVEGEHEALAADAVAERLEKLLPVVLVGVLERVEQRLARRLVRDAAQAVRRFAPDLGVGIVDELHERARPLRLGVARQHRRHELTHARALVARERGELVERDEARERLRVERGPAAHALDLREEAGAVELHRLRKDRLLAQRHERPHDLGPVAVVGRLERLEQGGLPRVGLGRAVVGQNLCRHAADAMIVAADRFDGEVDALGVLVPGELDEGLLLQHGLGARTRPFAPERDLVLLREDEDVLLLLRDLLDRELLALALRAEVHEHAEADDEQQADDDGERPDAALLEVAVVGSAAAPPASWRPGRGRPRRNVVVIRRPLGEEDRRRGRLRPSVRRSARCLAAIEHGPSWPFRESGLRPLRIQRSAFGWRIRWAGARYQDTGRGGVLSRFLEDLL